MASFCADVFMKESQTLSVRLLVQSKKQTFRVNLRDECMGQESASLTCGHIWAVLRH